MMMNEVSQATYKNVPVTIYCIEEGPYVGQYCAVVLPLSIRTSIRDSNGAAFDRAIANIDKHLAQPVN